MFQVAIHRNLVFVLSFANICTLIAHTVVFLHWDHSSFKPHARHWEVLWIEFKLSFFDLRRWLSLPTLTTRLSSRFIPKQSAGSAAGNIKRITCCAVEDISCNKPVWHWVVTTTDMKAFMNWLQCEALLCFTVSVSRKIFVRHITD